MEFLNFSLTTSIAHMRFYFSILLPLVCKFKLLLSWNKTLLTKDFNNLYSIETDLSSAVTKVTKLFYIWWSLKAHYQSFHQTDHNGHSFLAIKWDESDEKTWEFQHMAFFVEKMWRGCKTLLYWNVQCNFGNYMVIVGNHVLWMVFLYYSI